MRLINKKGPFLSGGYCKLHTDSFILKNWEDLVACEQVFKNSNWPFPFYEERKRTIENEGPIIIYPSKSNDGQFTTEYNYFRVHKREKEAGFVLHDPKDWLNIVDYETY